MWWNFGIELHLLSQMLRCSHTFALSLSLICRSVEMKSKNINTEIRTAVKLLREILLDSRGSNVSVQEMMQSLWWWPWWWNRHKQYTKQTYQVQAWWIFLCIAAVKKKDFFPSTRIFLFAFDGFFVVLSQNALLHILMSYFRCQRYD